jgi:hypothetical protein
VKIFLRGMACGIGFCFLLAALRAAELPQIKIENGTGQLIVKGQPFLILGGELGPRRRPISLLRNWQP